MADRSAELLTLFTSIGFAEKECEKFLSNKALVAKLETAIAASGFTPSATDGTRCTKATGNLLYTAASTIPKVCEQHLSIICRYIGSGQLTLVPQVEAAIRFVKPHALVDALPDVAAFEAACGVGVQVTEADVAAAVERMLADNAALIAENRYRTNIGQLLLSLRQIDERMKWVDGSVVRSLVERRLGEILGPKTEEDLKEPEKKKKVVPAKAPEAAKTATTADAPAEEECKSLRQFVARDLILGLNSAEILEKHKAATGGLTHTRFPPEPNGYLHLGHAKAMNLDFGYAMETGGNCYLRFDDTNPEKETQEYIDSIVNSVGWLGFKPWKITYSSDHFQTLFDLAVELIKRDKAYVCHQNQEEMRRTRQLKIDSPWRNRPIEESLRLFNDMKNGKFAEGEVTLRVKGDMQADNPNMRDFVAYRIKYQPHPHAGDKWCIYPSYDYTHCLIDSLENITHSLCTLEFETRRDSYYWLLDSLDMYKPFVWEFSRLNVTYNVMSKRKMNFLVENGMVRGWNDPRLLTLDGLRRRGFTADGINAFCKAIGVSRKENVISHQLLEFFCRQDLDSRAPRAFAVLNPLKVTLTNFPADEVEQLKAPNFPTDQSRGHHEKPFSAVLYIDRSDFRLVDDPDYFGLAPNKTVGLRYAYNITCTEVVQDADGNVLEIKATVDKAKSVKPKGHIHWVAEPAPGKRPLTAEVRLYDVLFTVEDPSEAENWLDVINKDSEVVIREAFVDQHIAGSKFTDKFQFERVGFFSVDLDSTPEHLVINRTVTLKESYPKFATR